MYVLDQLALQIQQISSGWSRLVTFTLSTRSFDDDDGDDDDNDDDDGNGEDGDSDADGEKTGCSGEHFPAQPNS